MIKDVFEPHVHQELLGRINQLKTNSEAQWGKMNVAQMLAHCNVTYEMVYTDIHPKPNGFKRFLLKLFVKPMVVNNKPYGKNGRTAPQFLVSSEKYFDQERKRLLEHLQKTFDHGKEYFEGKESHSFGALTSNEWNALFYKHLDHHLRQFGC